MNPIILKLTQEALLAVATLAIQAALRGPEVTTTSTPPPICSCQRCNS